MNDSILVVRATEFIGDVLCKKILDIEYKILGILGIE